MSDTEETRHDRRKALTLAHLSDLHVQPGPAQEGLAACLRHVKAHPALPEFILGGGDILMDAMAATRQQTREGWDAFHQVTRGENSLPWVHAIGNHDVWGWNHEASGATGDERRYGKAWAMEELGLERPYYSFDRAGWHFVVLDSIHAWGKPGGGFSQAMLNPEQFEWLIGDLASQEPHVPILILSHHPIRSSIGFHTRPPHALPDGPWTLPNAWLHMDALRIEPVLRAHGNVRLCLSGHMHQRDRLEWAGIAHVNSGAVCGNLWKRDRPEMPQSYGIVTLYDNGDAEHEWVGGFAEEDR